MAAAFADSVFSAAWHQQRMHFGNAARPGSVVYQVICNCDSFMLPGSTSARSLQGKIAGQRKGAGHGRNAGEGRGAGKGEGQMCRAGQGCRQGRRADVQGKAGCRQGRRADVQGRAGVQGRGEEQGCRQGRVQGRCRAGQRCRAEVQGRAGMHGQANITCQFKGNTAMCMHTVLHSTLWWHATTPGQN